MFFNLGPFSFGYEEAPQQPRQNNQRPPQRAPPGGLFGGFSEFLNSSFMNPFHPPQPNQAEQN